MRYFQNSIASKFFWAFYYWFNGKVKSFEAKKYFAVICSELSIHSWRFFGFLFCSELVLWQLLILIWNCFWVNWNFIHFRWLHQKIFSLSQQFKSQIYELSFFTSMSFHKSFKKCQLKFQKLFKKINIRFIHVWITILSKNLWLLNNSDTNLWLRISNKKSTVNSWNVLNQQFNQKVWFAIK